jgi:AcrR family transcriptional regulator
MARTNSEKTTKELILDAAFSFCNEPRLHSFSMSELASKVGISKPAIYRHFKDKGAVLSAMYERFISTLAGYLLKMQEIASARDRITREFLLGPIAEIIQFFSDNSSYINYMMRRVSSEKNFEFMVRQDLESRGVKLLISLSFKKDSDGKHTIRNFERYIRQIYCGATIFTFVKGREKIRCDGRKTDDSAVFSRKVAGFLLHGLTGTTERGDELYPSVISVERMAVLDGICSIVEGTLPEENRIFAAFAEVIRKYKMTGMTVERIAAELNMAKSSLYEYFDNKNEMIKMLVAKELMLLNAIINENSSEAQNLTEYFYILIRTMYSFFMQHRSLIPICGWLLMITADEKFFHEFDSSSPWIDGLSSPIVRPDVGMEITPKEFVGWVSSLPISLVMKCAEHPLSQEEILQALKKMFEYVQNGIAPKR